MSAVRPALSGLPIVRTRVVRNVDGFGQLPSNYKPAVNVARWWRCRYQRRRMMKHRSRTTSMIRVSTLAPFFATVAMIVATMRITTERPRPPPTAVSAAPVTVSSTAPTWVTAARFPHVERAGGHELRGHHSQQPGYRGAHRRQGLAGREVLDRRPGHWPRMRDRSTWPPAIAVSTGATRSRILGSTSTGPTVSEPRRWPAKVVFAVFVALAALTVSAGSGSATAMATSPVRSAGRATCSSTSAASPAHRCPCYATRPSPGIVRSRSGRHQARQS